MFVEIFRRAMLRDMLVWMTGGSYSNGYEKASFHRQHYSVNTLKCLVPQSGSKKWYDTDNIALTGISTLKSHC